MRITQEKKEEIFQKVHELEKKADTPTLGGSEYLEQLQGACKVLKCLGLSSEYIKWTASEWRVENAELLGGE